MRLPIGYWALRDDAPFRSSQKYVDLAFAWAQKHGLQVLLDLHGVPGSQNGWDHSGRAGEINWTRPENRARTLQVLEELARRYGQLPSLRGLQVANEPRWDVPLDFLRAFYREAYARLRPLLPERVAFVYHDGFRANSWRELFSGDAYQNCVLDTHVYQAYTDEDKKLTLAGHAVRALERMKELDEIKSQAWTIVGEWSIAMAWDSVKDAPPLIHEFARRAYAAAQLLNFERARLVLLDPARLR
jgi:glucan 1,3-beta-glucosidase